MVANLSRPSAAGAEPEFLLLTGSPSRGLCLGRHWTTGRRRGRALSMGGCKQSVPDRLGLDGARCGHRATSCVAPRPALTHCGVLHFVSCLF